MASKVFNVRNAIALVAALALGSIVIVHAGQAGRAGQAAVAVDADDIGGVVTGARGPEAGVWVIAETRTLPTRLIKIVVTDDQGRFVVPDLPEGGLRRVGPRLRPRRFAESESDARARRST